MFGILPTAVVAALIGVRKHARDPSVLPAVDLLAYVYAQLFLLVGVRWRVRPVRHESSLPAG